MKFLKLAFLFTLFCYSSSAVSLELKKAKKIVNKAKTEFYNEFPYARKVQVYITPMAPPMYAGICDPWGGYVLLNRDWVKSDSVSPENLKSLVFHELSHCGLDLAHAAPKEKSIISTRSTQVPVTKVTIQELKNRHKNTCKGILRGVYSQVEPGVKYKHISCVRRGL